jgi:signal transduction histidine kinase
MYRFLPASFWSRSLLRDKFTVSFILFSSIPLLLLGVTTIYALDLSHRRDVSNLELQLIAEKSQEVANFLEETTGLLELWVGFTQRSEIERAQQFFLLKGILEENEAFEEVSFIGLDGKETAVLLRNGEERKPLDASLLEKFRIASEGKLYAGEAVSTLTGPLITFASPVRNRNGEVIQVLSAKVNLLKLTRSIANAKIGFSGYLILLDGSGSLIASGINSAPSAAFALAHSLRVKRILKGEILSGLDERDRYLSVLADQPVVGAGKKIPGIEWILLAEWPIHDADAIINDIKFEIVRLTVITILVMILIAGFFANRLVLPIRQLEAGARAIEQGNFDARVKIRTKDELEELGASFNTMAQGLKRLEELRNEFVFIAAHELRSPVTAVKGFLSFIFEGSAGAIPPRMRHYLEVMSEANDRLVRLVSDLLVIARSEAGRLMVDLSACDIAETIRAALVEVEPLAREKHLTRVYEPFPGLPLVSADPLRVKEVLINLISNAIKYNRDGGRVRIFHEVSPGEVWTSVEDTGIGFGDEERKHVFEKFFRSERPEVKKQTGTGLGLFIVKEIVEKMGGKIELFSREGEGSTFRFSLAIAKAQETAGPVPRSPSQEKKEES